MSEERLSADLQALLRVEREGEDVPSGLEERLRARLAATIGGGGGGGGPEGGEPGPSGPTPRAPSTLGRVASHASVFAAGALAGAIAMSLFEPSAPTPHVPPPVEEPVDRPPVDRPPVDRPPVDRPPVDRPPVDRPPVDRPPVDRPPVDRPPVDRPEDPAPDADGRALIRQARVALNRGLTEDALDALARHRAAHPHGTLTEEREALTVQALAAAGQPARARQEAAVFLARYPDSIYAESVRAAAAR